MFVKSVVPLSVDETTTRRYNYTAEANETRRFYSRARHHGYSSQVFFPPAQQKHSEQTDKNRLKRRIKLITDEIK